MMRSLTVVAVFSALSGCAGGGQTGAGELGLTQERIDAHEWLYNPVLTDVPIAADELAGPAEGFARVDLRRYRDEIVACVPGYSGRALGVWRDGEVEQGGENAVVMPGGDHDGALVTDVNMPRQTSLNGLFQPDAGIRDRFGLQRFGDTMRGMPLQGDFYLFHPGCV